MLLSERELTIGVMWCCSISKLVQEVGKVTLTAKDKYLILEACVNDDDGNEVRALLLVSLSRADQRVACVRADRHSVHPLQIPLMHARVECVAATSPLSAPILV